MKNLLFLLALSCFCTLNFISCNSGNNSDEKSCQDTCSTSKQQTNMPDYSGVYKTSADNPCQLSITISKQNEGYNYQLMYNNQNYEGKLSVKEEEGNVYLTFDGKIEDNKPKSVEGQFIDGKIMIQNYGNAMNEFQLFKACDEKYLEFTKS